MKKMRWGEDPEFHGPRNYVRETLMLLELLKRKNKGSVLDFGCGSGKALMRLGNYGFHGIGVDISKSAIVYANKKNKNNSIRFMQINNFKDLTKRYRDKFDVVWSGEVLEHMKHDEEIILLFSKVLKKGGLCIVSVPAHRYLWNINDNFSGHYRRYEMNALVKKFNKAGIRSKNIFYWGFPLSYLWEKYVYLPMINKKIKNNTNYSRSSILGKFMKVDFLVKLFSVPFWADNLFNWTKLGGGLLFIGEKI